MVSDRGLALAVYIFYIVGYYTALTALIGVIIAHAQVGDSDPVLRSHYQFQIRTFWIGLLYLVSGVVLCLVLVGFAVLVWWFVWSLIRIIKGMVALNRARPIANPTSWLFG
jgi:uncharacterized membrane protein